MLAPQTRAYGTCPAMTGERHACPKSVEFTFIQALRLIYDPVHAHYSRDSDRNAPRPAARRATGAESVDIRASRPVDPGPGRGIAHRRSGGGEIDRLLSDAGTERRLRRRGRSLHPAESGLAVADADGTAPPGSNRGGD